MGIKKSIVEFIILVFGVTVSFGIEQQGGESENRSDGIENLVNLREEVDEMITMFNVNGAMLYLNDDDETVGYEDVFTKINMCRSYYKEIGLGSDFVDQFIR